MFAGPTWNCEGCLHTLMSERAKQTPPIVTHIYQAQQRATGSPRMCCSGTFSRLGRAKSGFSNEPSCDLIGGINLHLLFPFFPKTPGVRNTGNPNIPYFFAALFVSTPQSRSALPAPPPPKKKRKEKKEQTKNNKHTQIKEDTHTTNDVAPGFVFFEGLQLVATSCRGGSAFGRHLAQRRPGTGGACRDSQARAGKPWLRFHGQL